MNATPRTLRPEKTPVQPVRVRRGDIVETSLETYLREINELPLLNAAEEKQLAYRIAQGDREARDRMIRANLRLVVSVARRFNNRGLPFPDLIAEGNIGLLRAVEGFDPSMNTRFSTYATLWIKQAIRRGLVNTARTIRLPSHMVELLAKWTWTKIDLQKKLGHPPTEEEIAGKMGIAKKKLSVVKRALRIQNTAMQFDQPESGFALDETMIDAHARAPDSELDAADEWQIVLNRLAKLCDREAAVLRMRFGLGGEQPRTLKEVGELFDLTRERVRQIERAALEKLRAELKN